MTGFSRADLLEELFVAPRRTIVPHVDSVVVERPGWWQITTPSLAMGGLNEVVCTEDPDDATLDAAIAAYRRGRLRFRFTLGPGAPPGLGERLARRGLERADALGMARATAGVEAPADTEEVTRATEPELTRVMAEGWQADPVALGALHRRYLADPGGRSRLFLARLDGVGVAAAGTALLDRSAYLVGAVTLPAARGRGLYRALVHARLAHAAARGLPIAVSLARAESSAPILTRMGFETVCPVTIYRG